MPQFVRTQGIQPQKGCVSNGCSVAYKFFLTLSIRRRGYPSPNVGRSIHFILCLEYVMQDALSVMLITS